MSEKEIAQLEEELKCYSHELVKLADLLEGAEGSYRRSIARDYKITSKAYFKAQKRLDELRRNKNTT